MKGDLFDKTTWEWIRFTTRRPTEGWNESSAGGYNRCVRRNRRERTQPAEAQPGHAAAADRVESAKPIEAGEPTKTGEAQ